MGQSDLRTSSAMAIVLALSPIASAAQNQMDIDIPSQPLGSAITELGQETGLNVSVSQDLVSDLISPAVTGSMTPMDALNRLLLGTGLTPVDIKNDSVAITQDVVSQNAAEEPFDLGTIVVTTARRTLEPVEDVPGKVVVLSDNFLNDSNITDFAEATEFLPNVNVGTNSDPRRGEISIRGISNLNIASTSPTIGVFQDGILQNGTGLRFNINPSLRDLERVEVLYGPQGTAYGRGTIGGAINYVTAKPVFEREGYLRLSYNDLDEIDGEVVFNTPLSDTTAARALVYGNNIPGFVAAPNAPETDSIGSDNYGGRLSFLWQPNTQFRLDATIQHDESSYDGSFAATVESIESGNPVQLSNTVPGVDIRRTNYRLNASYVTGFGTFISTTGYLDSGLAGTEDFDLGIDDSDVLVRDNFEDTFSQEFRFESREFDAGTGQISFNIGLNYSDTSAETQSNFRTADFFNLGPGASNTIATRDVQNRSIFGDVRWQPTQKLEVAVGARYSDDKATVRSQFVTSGSIGVLLPSIDQTLEADFSGFTPSISVKYDWSSAFSTYAIYSTGYKPGGFANRAGVAGLAPFAEETADNYEVGFRSSLFENRLIINGSLFRLDYTDIQVPLAFDPANGLLGGVDNAAAARSEGFEISINANPLPGLQIGGGFGYTDARFTDYTDSNVGDLTGTALPNAPKRTYNLIADYEFQTEFRGFTPFIRGEFTGRTNYQSTAGGTSTEIGDYNLFNLRTGLRGDNANVTLFVENLFDETYAVDAFAGNLVPGKPRTFGILGFYRF